MESTLSISACLTAAEVRAGSWAKTSAAAPAACGVAIDVPARISKPAPVE
jgi:hypothetical protein